MSLIFKRFLPGVLALMLLLPTTGWAEPLCKSLFIQPIENIVVHDKIFSQKIKNLRNTLSGKLATVWRSEWKTKLSVAESNRYTFDLINHFLTVESRAFVLDGLDLGHEGFTDKYTNACMSYKHLKKTILKIKFLFATNLPRAVPETPPLLITRNPSKMLLATVNTRCAFELTCVKLNGAKFLLAALSQHLIQKVI
ncbi:MAG: hypothetical protein A3D17_12870 [Bdellovibrionales bacterium RIFCSPHIGHO2_02_FULL_40_15]|nr:MAG: hypothetical protein A3D17_12870 [Bdellovibrionales bacterium RIFCSPHIGHO2_02_FULL_40_15]